MPTFALKCHNHFYFCNCNFYKSFLDIEPEYLIKIHQKYITCNKETWQTRHIGHRVHDIQWHKHIRRRNPFLERWITIVIFTVHCQSWETSCDRENCQNRPRQPQGLLRSLYIPRIKFVQCNLKKCFNLICEWDVKKIIWSNKQNKNKDYSIIILYIH